jgi:hypothetical protein
VSIPDHEIEVGPWPDNGGEMRRCENCVHWGTEPSALLPIGVSKSHPCHYPMPEFMVTFFEIAANTLPTDGRRCAVHQLDGEPSTCHK